MVFHPVRPDRTACGAAPLQQARALSPLSTVRRRPAPAQACAPSLSVSTMMSRLFHRSNWRSSCHPVGAYHPRPSPTTVTEITPPSTASSISSQPQTLAAALICSLLPSASSASQDQNMEICELRIFLVLSPLSYSPTLWCFWFQFCLNLICNFFDFRLGPICSFSMWLTVGTTIVAEPPKLSRLKCAGHHQ